MQRTKETDAAIDREIERLNNMTTQHGRDTALTEVTIKMAAAVVWLNGDLWTTQEL
jgi:hypothetical protein